MAVCISWGTTYLATRVAIESIPPFAMAGSRHFVAGLILAFVLWARGVKMPSRESWRGHALLGFSMIGLGNGCLVWAQQFVPSGVAAVMVSVIPFWMIGVEALMPGGERIRLSQFMGLLLGFGGILLLASSSLNNDGASTTQIIVGVIMLQLSCFGWSLGSAYAKRHKREEDLFAATAMQIVLGGVILMMVATILGEWPRVHPTGKSLLARALSDCHRHIRRLRELRLRAQAPGGVHRVSLRVLQPGDCGDSWIAHSEGALHGAYGRRDRDYFCGDGDCAER